VTQPESRLSRKIQTELRARGWFCNKNHGSEFTMAGLPDITVCAQGLYIGLETKMPGEENNTSPRQKYVHGKIRDAGGAAFVVSSVDEAVRVVQQVLRDAGIT
jgi:hypothetical protein